MSESVNDYYQLVQEPWGRMFYDLVWEQADNILVKERQEVCV